MTMSNGIKESLNFPPTRKEELLGKLKLQMLHMAITPLKGNSSAVHKACYDARW